MSHWKRLGSASDENKSMTGRPSTGSVCQFRRSQGSTASRCTHMQSLSQGRLFFHSWYSAATHVPRPPQAADITGQRPKSERLENEDTPELPPMPVFKKGEATKVKPMVLSGPAAVTAVLELPVTDSCMCCVLRYRSVPASGRIIFKAENVPLPGVKRAYRSFNVTLPLLGNADLLPFAYTIWIDAKQNQNETQRQTRVRFESGYTLSQLLLDRLSDKLNLSSPLASFFKPVHEAMQSMGALRTTDTSCEFAAGQSALNCTNSSCPSQPRDADGTSVLSDASSVQWHSARSQSGSLHNHRHAQRLSSKSASAGPSNTTKPAGRVRDSNALSVPSVGHSLSASNKADRQQLASNNDCDIASSKRGSTVTTKQGADRYEKSASKPGDDRPAPTSRFLQDPARTKGKTRSKPTRKKGKRVGNESIDEPVVSEEVDGSQSLLQRAAHEVLQAEENQETASDDLRFYAEVSCGPIEDDACAAEDDKTSSCSSNSDPDEDVDEWSKTATVLSPRVSCKWLYKPHFGERPTTLPSRPVTASCTEFVFAAE
ncbi:hypothetical protein DIPPA_51864, partial [Diplonema papillatum]